jgi:hypothetical protein
LKSPAMGVGEPIKNPTVRPQWGFKVSMSLTG